MIGTRSSSPTVREGVLSSRINFHRSMRDFDDNEFPLAYLITLRTYGIWLHGDERGSMDRKNNIYGTSTIAQNPRLQSSDAKQLKHPPVTLSGHAQGFKWITFSAKPRSLTAQQSPNLSK